MIIKHNLPQFLTCLGFTKQNQTYVKSLHGYELKIDFANEKIIYPKGVTAHRDTTKNFSQPENFVVFECVHNLLAAIGLQTRTHCFGAGNARRARHDGRLLRHHCAG